MQKRRLLSTGVAASRRLGETEQDQKRPDESR
jgi:hypothetical protein